MYSDPSKIRKHEVKVRFSDEERKLLDAIVEYTGEQKATLMREMILSYGETILEVPGKTNLSA